jgi:hypothetical protein
MDRVRANKQHNSEHDSQQYHASHLPVHAKP